MINNFFRRLLDSDFTYKQTPIEQMMKRELQEDNWDFALYGVGGVKIISVVFHNSFIDFSRSFLLNEVEAHFSF